jgi:ribosome biogenesis GTPase
MNDAITLRQLGWRPALQQQLSLDEWETSQPVRVMEQHRGRLDVAGESRADSISMTPNMPGITVGDWLLLDEANNFVRLLDRFSIFTRKAVGAKSQTQLIAANVDTVFIVSSLNKDFNLNRIERYLVIAHEAQVEPVIILSKLDECEGDPACYRQQVQNLDPLLGIELVNGLDPGSVDQLRPWCRDGQTLAFIGSSGVGKSTLVNTLLDDQVQSVSGIREDDSKGRHTTTSRSMHILSGGGLLLDTPGMRELQLGEHESGIASAFEDIENLAQQCRFSDCQHEEEPGCVVTAAVEAGKLDERRLANYRKLLREQAFNSASLAQRRASDKKLGKFYRSVQQTARASKEGDSSS